MPAEAEPIGSKRLPAAHRVGGVLFALPDLGAGLMAAGIGPHSFPVAAVGAVKLETGVVAGLVGDGEEVLVTDAGADEAGSATTKITR